jgi:thiamine pyrophosphate-dependent acetolactate synthase large subunit-like protein
VPGRQATDLTSLAQAFQAALAEEGPFLIEVLM